MPDRYARRAALFVILSGLCLVPYGCGSGGTGGSGAGPGRLLSLSPNVDTVLRVGEVRRFGGGETLFRIVGVTEDSRCGTEENCVRAGDVEVAAEFIDDGDLRAVRARLSQPEGATTETAAGRPTYRLFLVAVEPQRRNVSETISPGRYRLTLRVVPL